MQTEGVKLSTLKKEYELNHVRTAMHRMRKRSKVHIDEEFVHQVNDANLAWGATEHFLDYYLLVSAKKGLHAILPKGTRDVSYSFSLDLNHSKRTWKARYAELGFDPAGRMLWIGRYHQEDVWLAMVPRCFTNEDVLAEADEMTDDARNMVHLDCKRTTMSEGHACMMVSMIATFLAQLGFHDIYIRDKTPEDLTIDGMKRVTNLL